MGMLQPAGTFQELLGMFSPEEHRSALVPGSFLVPTAEYIQPADQKRQEWKLLYCLGTRASQRSYVLRCDWTSTHLGIVFLKSSVGGTVS